MKFGIPENSVFENSPMLGAGIFNIGTKSNITDQDISYLILGKTLPDSLGRLSLGGYIGNAAILKDSSGNVDNAGFMVAYDKYLYKDKVLFATDFASGKNALGGGGAGVYYFFIPDISILMGPVWFNDEVINGKWKWTSQIDVNF